MGGYEWKFSSNCDEGSVGARRLAIGKHYQFWIAPSTTIAFIAHKTNEGKRDLVIIIVVDGRSTYVVWKLNQIIN